MWEISNILQFSGFLRSLALGIILCVFYDIFSALRKAEFNSTTAVLIQDIIYFLITAPIVFLFLLATTNGQLRLYVFVGTVIGFIIFKLSLSKLLVFLLSRFFLLLKFIFSNISRVIRNFLNFSEHYIVINIKNMVNFFKKTIFTSKNS